MWCYNGGVITYSNRIMKKTYFPAVLISLTSWLVGTHVQLRLITTQVHGH